MSYLSKNNLFALALTVAIVLEAISIVELTLTPSIEITTPDPIVGLMMGAFNWLIPLAPFLMLCLLYFPIVRAAFSWAGRRSEQIKHLNEKLSTLKDSIDDTGRSHQTKFDLSERSRAVLIISVIVTTLLAYFPYRSDVNPQQIIVGIDAPHYVTAINQMLTEPVSAAVSYALGVAWSGSRPLFLLMLYGVVELADLSSNLVIMFLPAVLAPLLVLSSYFLVLTGTRSKGDASLAALLTAFSPVLTVGIWAGYYPNWLALIESFALLGTLLLYLRSYSALRFAACILLSLALVLTHLWTWLVVTAVTVIFLFSLRREIHSQVSLKLGGSILSTYLFAELLKSGLLIGTRVAATGKLVEEQITNPLSNVVAFFPNFVNGLLLTYEGLLANSVIIALALLAVIVLRYGERFERLLLFWVVMTSLSLPILDDLLQSRMIYNLPITILASLGLLRFVRSTPLSMFSKTLIVILVVLFNANYALLAVARPPLL